MYGIEFIFFSNLVNTDILIAIKCTIQVLNSEIIYLIFIKVEVKCTCAHFCFNFRDEENEM